MITEPTRITSTSSSLIDHIFTNVSDLISESGVIPEGFSDHLVTFSSRSCAKEVFSGQNVRFVRSFKDYSKASFTAALSRISWSSVLNSADIDFCLLEFNRLFCSVIDTVAPLREIRVRNKLNPWMNSHIFSGI